MNRKNFISFLTMAGAVFPAMRIKTYDDKELQTIIPPYLYPGDTIGITSPAGYITLSEIQSAIQQMQGWGFNIKIGNAIDKRNFTFGGTDEERMLDFQQLMDDLSVKAIMCARGGYGFVRIIDQLNFEKLILKPNGLLVLVISPCCTITSIEISELRLSIPKCVTVFQAIGVNPNPYKWKPFIPSGKH